MYLKNVNKTMYKINILFSIRHTDSYKFLALIAASGDLFDFSFDLPFTEFLPDTLPLRFWIQGESIDLSLYLPEVYTSRSVLLSLNQNAKLLGRDGKIFKSKLDDSCRKWRNVCQKE